MLAMPVENLLFKSVVNAISKQRRNEDVRGLVVKIVSNVTEYIDTIY